MAWVAVDYGGTEWISEHEPIRDSPGYFEPPQYWSFYSDKIMLPKGSIKKLLERELSWSDEPVELKED